MKPQLLVVGGGFAGVWATAAARARGGDAIEVTLVTASRELTIRPRLYEADVNATLVPLEPIVTGLGALLRIGTVTAIDTDHGSITAGGTQLRADAVILAAGSTSPIPPIPGLAEHGHRIDIAEHAVRLRQEVERRERSPLRVTVVGGGLTGVELAAELASEADVSVTLVDGGRIGDGFGPDGRAVVRDALTQLGVTMLDDTRLQAVGPTSATTTSGTLEHDLLVWCGGLRANPLTELIPATRDEVGRLHVDTELRVVDLEGLWAAGDVARTSPDDVHVAPMSCQFAIPMGRIAGHNAAAALLDGLAAPFEVDRYVTCVDLGAAGALFTTGWDRAVRRTGADGKAMKRHINHVAIHPPTNPDVFVAAAQLAASASWG